MRVLFIRHAEAVDREDFQGEDLERPLTSSGRRSAKLSFRQLARVLERPDLVMTSEAVRALETADLFQKAFGRIKRRATPLLNPGADFRRFKTLVAGLPTNVDSVTLVGHEPDISRIVARAVGGGQLDIRVKKGACVEMEIDRACRRGTLRLLVHPDVLIGNGKHRGAAS